MHTSLRHHFFSAALIALCIGAALALPHITSANNVLNYAPDPAFASGAGLPTSGTSPSEIVINGIRILMQILGLVALVLIIYAGFTMLTSAGNSEKVSKAKEILVWAVIGIVIILSSIGIVEFIDNAFF